ncbi:MAG: ABC transporter ATP-binding protein [Alphaproteobacteria bacterium]
MTMLLELENVIAGHGDSVVLNGLYLSVNEGRALALLGRNGTGKTTAIETIVGLTAFKSGSIRLAGRDIARLPAEKRAAAGIGWVPQERSIFKSLTVEENLTALAMPGPWTPKRAFEMFPRLGERRSNLGNQLSGGEQQMLAVARALMLNPRVLLLDEPLEGLAPIIVDELLSAIGRLVRDEGMAAIIVEQKARKVLPLTDSAIILDRGSVVWRGASDQLLADTAALNAHLGVADAKL